jgi:hypothetical protein
MTCFGIFGVLGGVLAAFVAGFFFGALVMRPADDPLSVERMSQTPAPPKRFFPGEPDEPVYDLPNWDLPA